MDTKEVLTKARDLIADESHWCQGHLAVDPSFAPCDSGSWLASAWCADGAIYRVADTAGVPSREARDLLTYAARDIAHDPHEFSSTFNDERSHAEVLRMFDCAIAKASA